MKRGIHWIPEAAVRAMHAELIAEHGGGEGLRDAGLLSSALARPKNRRVYGRSSSIFDLAAVYGAGIVRNHPFIDGNKRVGAVAAYIFLVLNNLRLTADQVNYADLVLSVACGETPKSAVAEFFRENVIPM